jgi:transposase
LRWRDAPKEYGPHKTLYNRWKRWSDKRHLCPDDGRFGCRAW